MDSIWKLSPNGRYYRIKQPNKDKLETANYIESRAEFRDQLHKLIHSAKAFEISSDEMKHIFREELGDIIEVEYLERELDENE